MTCDVCGQALPETPPRRRGRPLKRHPACSEAWMVAYRRGARCGGCGRAIARGVRCRSCRQFEARQAGQFLQQGRERDDLPTAELERRLAENERAVKGMFTLEPWAQKGPGGFEL